jgi:hypothetical protein
MLGRFLGLVASATILIAVPTGAWAQKVDAQKVRNLKSQQTDIENRIADLQRQVDDAYAGKTYCSAEERTEDLTKLRALQAQIAALRSEYAKFKAGFIKMAATPTAGPQLDAAGIRPDERSYWTADDNALQKLRDSALAKANRVEQATIRDCSEKKTVPGAASPPLTQTPPVTAPPPAPPKKAPTPEPQQPPSNRPKAGCTDNERTEAILRIQDEILRLEEERAPIDGITPEGRARRSQLTAEIDRLGKLLYLDCPPLLAPPKPLSAPLPQQPTRQPVGTQPPPKPPAQVVGLGEFPMRLTDPFLKLEFEADDALDELDDAMDDCDEQAVKNLIPKLEDLSKRAHAAADAAKAAGQFSRIDPKEAEAMAKDLDEAIADARKFKCVRRYPRGYRLLPISSFGARVLDLHNEERSAVHVPPLKWDFRLEWNAIGYADHLALTHDLVHAPREGRGIERENLLQVFPGWSADRMIQSWTMEKRNFVPGYFPNVARDGDWLHVSHYSQIIWPTTIYLGCGYEEDGGYGWLVCRYSPGGNKDGKPVGLPYMPERG